MVLNVVADDTAANFELVAKDTPTAAADTVLFAAKAAIDFSTMFLWKIKNKCRTTKSRTNIQ